MWKFFIFFVSVAYFRLSGAGCFHGRVQYGQYGAPYGAQPCTYVPAPPGRAPPCAKPGDTFCEQLPQYPMQTIKLLIDKWGYDYSTLFSSETKDEYRSHFQHHEYGYIPNKLHHDSYFPESISPSGGGRYNYSDNFAGYPDRRPPSSGIDPGGSFNHPHNHINHHDTGRFRPYYPQTEFSESRHGPPHLSHTDPNSWWRFSRMNKIYQPHYRSKRSSKSGTKSKKKKFLSPKNETAAVHSRTKRQNGLGSGGQTLCQTRAQFIMPKAAVNKEGNWMYVVNLQEVDNRLTQLVKSETCATEQCSGLCSLPLGYTSRCEQKYVQKRLVALEQTGQRLYTDVFWFPSCCICTISNG